MSYPKRTRDQHFSDDGPKRILALDGGASGAHPLGPLLGHYDFGRSGVQDYSRAASLYIAAANLTYAPAMNSLGRLYEIGQGVQKNEQQAVTWYEKAASLGHPDAIASLNRLKARGLVKQ